MYESKVCVVLRLFGAVVAHAAQVGVGFGASNLNLVKDLLPLMPRGLDTFVFLNSGSEAVENAVKLARQATGKPNVIVFKVCLHVHGWLQLPSAETSLN